MENEIFDIITDKETISVTGSSLKVNYNGEELTHYSILDRNTVVIALIPKTAMVIRRERLLGRV